MVKKAPGHKSTEEMDKARKKPRKGGSWIIKDGKIFPNDPAPMPEPSKKAPKED